MTNFKDLEKLYSEFYRVQSKMSNNAKLIDCVRVFIMIGRLKTLVKNFEDACIDEASELRDKIISPLKSALEKFS